MHGGVVGVDPLSLLVHDLTSRFAQLEDESSNALLGFSRNRGESIDSVHARFKLVRMLAQQEGGGALGLELLSPLQLKEMHTIMETVAQINEAMMMRPRARRHPWTKQQMLKPSLPVPLDTNSSE
eukprot:114420-Amphidinium_carterae.2